MSNFHVYDAAGLGAVEIKDYAVGDARYAIAGYRRDPARAYDRAVGMFRSVVFSAGARELLCVSPPQSLSPELFDELHGSGGDRLVLSEIAEGTMVSLFYDYTRAPGRWEIATRGAVGGNYSYFRTQYPAEAGGAVEGPRATFRQMFLAALGREMAPDAAVGFDLAAALPAGVLERRDTCFTFVLQHPDNHIVLDVSAPRLVLVGMQFIEAASGREALNLSHLVYNATVVSEMFAGSGVLAPRELSPPATDDPYEFSTATCPGAMITHLASGDRMRVDNPAYLALAELRGNHPNLQYRFLELARAGQTGAFLAAFPRYTALFAQFEAQLGAFARGVSAAYTWVRVKARAQAPARFRRHVVQLRRGAAADDAMTDARALAYLHTLDVGDLHRCVYGAPHRAPRHAHIAGEKG